MSIRRAATWEAPRGYDLNVRLQCIVCQFKSDLVVALACAAMGDGLAAFFLRNLDLTTGNDRTRKGSSKKIDTLNMRNPRKEDDIPHKWHYIG